MQTVHTKSDPSKSLSTKVLFDKDLEEYVVEVYRKGVHLPLADYFANDREDAIGTANYIVDNS